MSGDRLILGMAGGGDFRVIAAQTTNALEEARLRCDLAPVAAAALGRAITSAVLLARLLDKQLHHQHVSLRIDGDGPLGAVIAEATIEGDVRGYVANPRHEDTSCAVGDAVGRNGKLTVVRKAPPLGKPYTSQVQLVSGEIARDVAHYLASSEQIPSALLLGEINRPEGVSACGGIVIQAFPHASQEAIAAVEHGVRTAPPLSLLLDGLSIDQAVSEILQGVDYKRIDPSFDIPITYRCSCTRDKALSLYQFFTPLELGEMIREKNDSEATCQFCGKRYTFSSDDLMRLETPPDA
jgi:molecular chaperone Hsp33